MSSTTFRRTRLYLPSPPASRAALTGGFELLCKAFLCVSRSLLSRLEASFFFALLLEKRGLKDVQGFLWFSLEYITDICILWAAVIAPHRGQKRKSPISGVPASPAGWPLSPSCEDLPTDGGGEETGSTYLSHKRVIKMYQTRGHNSGMTINT